STTKAPLTASQSSPMLLKKLDARTPIFWPTADPRGRTSGDVGWSIWCWGRVDVLDPWRFRSAHENRTGWIQWGCQDELDQAIGRLGSDKKRTGPEESHDRVGMVRLLRSAADAGFPLRRGK